MQRIEVVKAGAPRGDARAQGQGRLDDRARRHRPPTRPRCARTCRRSARRAPTDFPDDARAELAKYGLDKPRLTITVATGKDGAHRRAAPRRRRSRAASRRSTIYVKRQRADGVRGRRVGVAGASTRTRRRAPRQDRPRLRSATRVGARRPRAQGRHGRDARRARRRARGRSTASTRRRSKGTAIQRFVDDLKDLKGSAVAAEPAGRPHAASASPRRRSASRSPTRTASRWAPRSPPKQDAKYYVDARRRPARSSRPRDYMYTRLDKQARDFEAERHDDDARPRRRRARRRRRRRAARRRRRVTTRSARRARAGVRARAASAAQSAARRGTRRSPRPSRR